MQTHHYQKNSSISVFAKSGRNSYTDASVSEVETDASRIEK